MGWDCLGRWEAWAGFWMEEIVAHLGLEVEHGCSLGGRAYRWRLSLLEFHNSFAYVFAFSHFVTQAFEVTRLAKQPHFSPSSPSSATITTRPIQWILNLNSACLLTLLGLRATRLILGKFFFLT